MMCHQSPNDESTLLCLNSAGVQTSLVFSSLCCDVKSSLSKAPNKPCNYNKKTQEYSFNKVIKSFFPLHEFSKFLQNVQRSQITNITPYYVIEMVYLK